MVHDLWLVQVRKPEESKYPWDYYRILATIPGEEAFGPPNPECPLVKITTPGIDCATASVSTGKGCCNSRPVMAELPPSRARPAQGRA